MIKSRGKRWAGHVTRLGEERCIQSLLGRLEGRRPLGRQKRRKEDNIKMDMKWEGGLDWIDVAEDRDMWWVLVNAVMNLWVP
jgi:hypothetical protein